MDDGSNGDEREYEMLEDALRRAFEEETSTGSNKLPEGIDAIYSISHDDGDYQVVLIMDLSPNLDNYEKAAKDNGLKLERRVSLGSTLTQEGRMSLFKKLIQRSQIEGFLKKWKRDQIEHYIKSDDGEIAATIDYLPKLDRTMVEFPLIPEVDQMTIDLHTLEVYDRSKSTVNTILGYLRLQREMS